MADIMPAIAITAPEGSSAEPTNPELPALFSHMLQATDQIGLGSPRPSVRHVQDTASEADGLDRASIHAASMHEGRAERTTLRHPTTDLPPLEHTRPWEKEPTDRHFVKDVPSHIGRGPNADIWKLYEEKAKEVDTERLETWDKGIDVLLLFAALFSAVVTAFLAISLGMLLPDNSTAMVAALEILSSQINAANTNGVAQPSPFQPSESFSPTGRAIWVNALWILSLTISLYTAVLGMLFKQWLRTYTSHLSSEPHDRARQRHFRYMGLHSWEVPGIVDSLTLLLHLAVFLFFVGFPIYLWTLHAILALALTIFWVIGMLAYLFLAVAPLFWVSCPYNSALTRILAFLGGPFRYVSGKGKKLREALLTEATRETGRVPWSYTLRALLKELRTVEVEGTWLHRRADEWIAKKTDELDTSAFGWLQSICQRQDEKDIVLCAFFGWKPNEKQWDSVRETIEEAAKSGIFHLTHPSAGNEDYLGNKETWEMVSGPLIKLAVCVQFAPGFLKIYAPTWHEHPWAKKSLSDMADDTTRLLHLVLRLWCCRDDSLYPAYLREAIDEFTHVVRNRSCRPSQFGSWLLLEAAYMSLAGGVKRSDTNPLIHNILIPAVNELLATTSNLPDFIVGSALRLWTASAAEPSTQKKIEHRLTPTMTEGVAAAWTELLNKKLTPEIHLALKSYLVHNMGEEDIDPSTVSELVKEVVTDFQREQLLYPQRINARPQLTAEHCLKVRLAAASMRVLVDIGEDPIFSGIQLLLFDRQALNKLLPLDGKEPEQNVILLCAKIFYLYPTFDDFMANVRQQKDGQALVLATLIIAAAARADAFHGWFVYDPFPDAVVESGWMNMVHEFGYEEVIRQEPGLCEALDRILVRLAERKDSDIRDSGILDDLARDSWEGMSPELQGLLAGRTEWDRSSGGLRRISANDATGAETLDTDEAASLAGDPPSRDDQAAVAPALWTLPLVPSTLGVSRDAIAYVANITKWPFRALRDGLTQNAEVQRGDLELELGQIPDIAQDTFPEEDKDGGDRVEDDKTHDTRAR